MRSTILLSAVLLIPTSAIAQQAANAVAKPPPASLNLPSAQGQALEKKVNLELENATVLDAVTLILKNAGLPAQVVAEGDLPDAPRLTVRGVQASAQTALELVTEAGGVGWRLEDGRDGKLVFRLGKSLQGWSVTPYAYFLTAGNSFVLRQAPADTPALNVQPGQAKPPAVAQPQKNVRPGYAPMIQRKNLINPGFQVDPSIYQKYDLTWSNRLATFNCPHCQGKTQMVVQEQQVNCPQCKRALQAGWQFCPVDGTKRPATPGQWKFCPLCGKEVGDPKPAAPAAK